MLRNEHMEYGQQPTHDLDYTTRNVGYSTDNGAYYYYHKEEDWPVTFSMEETPPQVDHLDVVGRLTPSMNGNQEFTAPRSLVSQAGPSHWDVCSC
jgi:hypothetical protein